MDTQDIEEAIASETAPALPDLASLYKEAGVVLPELALRRYDEVLLFHEAVVKNRQTHLSEELSDTHARIKKREARRKIASEKRNELIGTMNSGGALSHYQHLASQLEKGRAELESLTRQLELAEKFDALNADLKVQRAEVERALKADLRERRPVIDKAAAIFDGLESKLYDAPATFDIRADKNGFHFTIEAPDLGSVGVQRAHVFVFDLLLSSICAERKSWPEFLVHDSHVFDGVDGRQIASALTLGGTQVSSFSGQYIVTMNSDDLDKASRESGTSFEGNIVMPTLDDTESGGLFGFRFATPSGAEGTEEAPD